jgi:hypothetical protein
MAVKKEKRCVTVEPTDASDNKLEAFKMMLDAATPAKRIQRIEKYLSTYNQENNCNVVKIREILSELKTKYPSMSLDEAGLEKLENAENIFNIIIVAPFVEARINQSKTNANSASNYSRKQLPLIFELNKCKDDYYAKEGKCRGWKKVACITFNISPKTLNKILKE